MSANDIAAVSERIHRKDVALMRQALEALEGWPGDIDCDCPGCAEIRAVIAALNERLLQE